MAIALKSGELYFITELDLLTGKQSGYYKIGLVKDARQGDSLTRLEEHQTGNPRQLLLPEIVTAPAIEALESAVHARFASHRVRGEWFKFSPAQLKLAISSAQELSAQLAEALPTLRQAERADGKQPTSTIGRPKPDDIERHRHAVTAKHLNARVKKLKSAVTDLLRAASRDGVDISGLAASSKASAPSVSKAKVAEVRPDLAEKFTTTTEKGKRAFSLLGSTGKALDVTLPKDFLATENDLVDLLTKKRRGRKHLEDVHGTFLEVLRFSSEADWAYEFAVAGIMASCGSRSGIDGICKWPWELKPSTSFDGTAFAKAHPALAKTCMTQPEPRFTVLPMKGYRSRR